MYNNNLGKIFCHDSSVTAPLLRGPICHFILPAEYHRMLLPHRQSFAFLQQVNKNQTEHQLQHGVCICLVYEKVLFVFITNSYTEQRILTNKMLLSP